MRPRWCPCGAAMSSITLMLMSIAMAIGLWYALVEAWR